MKRFIATVLFFASFGIVFAQSFDGKAQWFKILGIKEAPAVPATRSLTQSTDNSTQQKDKCNDPIEIAHCNMKAGGDGNMGNTCSGIYNTKSGLVYTDGNPPRCGGVRIGHDNYDNNPCRPNGCPKNPSSQPQPQPQPKPPPKPGPNCEWMNRELSALRERLKGLPDNDYFRGVRGFLKEKIIFLENILKKYCPKPEKKCILSNVKCSDNNDCTDNQKTPNCVTQGSTVAGKKTGICGSKDCSKGRCLSFTSKIATPRGEIAVTTLKVGDMVWTTDTAGNRIARPIVKVRNILVTNHRVVHLVLADGRALDVSATHPTANGRTVGDLIIGDAYNGSVVKSAELKPYEGTATYDILPAGDTGFYFANGILMGSTLK